MVFLSYRKKGETLNLSMKISIITATWNSGGTLQDTIDSVQRQMEDCRRDGVEVEHVIVDGGSTDDTIDIIRRNEGRYNGNLRWISEKDQGIYDAMNKGITMAEGDIVGLLNSDDFYTSDDVLATVGRVLKGRKDLDAVYGDIHYVKADNLKKVTRYFSSRFFSVGRLRFGFILAHPSFYCRREVYEKYGLYDLSLKTSADFEMIVRLFYKHRIRAQYVKKDFVTMREGGESNANIKCRYKVNRDIARSLKKHGIYSNQLMQGMRYLWRIGELVYTRVKY